MQYQDFTAINQFLTISYFELESAINKFFAPENLIKILYAHRNRNTPNCAPNTAVSQKTPRNQ